MPNPLPPTAERPAEGRSNEARQPLLDLEAITFHSTHSDLARPQPHTCSTSHMPARNLSTGGVRHVSMSVLLKERVVVRGAGQARGFPRDCARRLTSGIRFDLDCTKRRIGERNRRRALDQWIIASKTQRTPENNRKVRQNPRPHKFR